jgi:hypothetical protein
MHFVVRGIICIQGRSYIVRLSLRMGVDGNGTGDGDGDGSGMG